MKFFHIYICWSSQDIEVGRADTTILEIEPRIKLKSFEAWWKLFTVFPVKMLEDVFPP